jgi:hypothetical protein
MAVRGGEAFEPCLARRETEAQGPQVRARRRRGSPEATPSANGSAENRGSAQLLLAENPVAAAASPAAAPDNSTSRRPITIDRHPFRPLEKPLITYF